MLCSLLRVIQLYVVSTALFSTSSTVYTDKAFRPVALTHSVVHPPTHTNQTVTVLYQPSYRSCFVKEEMNPPQLIFHASQGFDMRKMKKSSKNSTRTSPVRKPRSKPTKKPVSQSVIQPHHVVVRDGKPVVHSHPVVHPTSAHSKPVTHSHPVVHPTSSHSKPVVHPTSGHSKPVVHSHPVVHPTSAHSKPVDHSKPVVHPTSAHSKPVNHSHPVVHPTSAHSKPVDHPTPASRPNPSTHPTPTSRPNPSAHPTPTTHTNPTPHPQPSIHPVRASSRNVAIFEDQYVSCVKAPQHLHGKVWESAKQMEIKYTKQSSRIHQCSIECKHEGFTYFAMESGTHCWCAHSLPLAEHLQHSMCSACDDSSSHTCGNVNYGLMSVYQISHPIVVNKHVPSIQVKKSAIVKPKMVAHSKHAVLPKLSNVRTFGSKYVSKALDFEHDLHLDAPPRKVSRLDAKLKKESDRLLKKLERHRARIHRIKRNRQFRRMKRIMEKKKREEEDDYDEKNEDHREEKHEEKENKHKK